jgi:predicted RNA binding protein YcfA (HicA-like mRNA interferase family)
MSPRLPRLTGKDVCKILERKGFTLKRVRGSHHFYVKDGVSAYVTVPVHGGEILHPKTLKSVLTQAKLTPEDLEK